MSEYKDIETVKYSFVVREDDETEFTAIRIDGVSSKELSMDTMRYRLVKKQKMVV